METSLKSKQKSPVANKDAINWRSDEVLRQTQTMEIEKECEIKLEYEAPEKAKKGVTLVVKVYLRHK